MSDDSQRRCWLINGPFGEPQPSGVYDKFLNDQGAIVIPLDDCFEITESAPYAFAVYWKSDLPGPLYLFTFAKFTKPDGSLFPVEFVGGPLHGTHEFYQPARAFHIVFVPVPSEPHSGKGRLKVVAQYENRGDDCLHFSQLHRQVVNDFRILVDFAGGPLDGRALDSDAMDLDRDGASQARFVYLATDNGQIGKRFQLMSPHAWQLIEKHGHDAPAGHMHKYEITDRLEENYEVLIRAKYIGVHPEKEST